MTLNEAIQHGKDQLEIFGGKHKEFIQTAIDTMRKYQKIQDIIEYHMLKSLPKKNMSGFQKDILEVLEDGNDN